MNQIIWSRLIVLLMLQTLASSGIPAVYLRYPGRDQGTGNERFLRLDGAMRLSRGLFSALPQFCRFLSLWGRYPVAGKVWGLACVAKPGGGASRSNTIRTAALVIRHR
jgi:hypothetical protein